MATSSPKLACPLPTMLRANSRKRTSVAAALKRRQSRQATERRARLCSARRALLWRARLRSAKAAKRPSKRASPSEAAARSAPSAIRRSRCSPSQLASDPKNKSNTTPSIAPATIGNAASSWIHNAAASHNGTKSHSPRLRKSLQRAARSRRIKRSATEPAPPKAEERMCLSSCCAVRNLHRSAQKSTNAASASKRTATAIGALVKKSSGAEGGKANSTSTSVGAARLDNPLTRRSAAEKLKASKEDSEDKRPTDIHTIAQVYNPNL